jgi:hypothetical protein
MINDNFYVWQKGGLCIEISFKRNYNCLLAGCGNDICRCSYITEEKIEKIDINRVVKYIYDKTFDNSLSMKRNKIIDAIIFNTNKDIDIYTIDRIARICKLYSEKSWDINICAGYYGQEIDTIKINNDIYIDFNSKLEIAFSLGLKERIEYILELEYGYILPELRDKNYELIKIKKNDIIFSNESHLEKVSQKFLEYYSDVNYSGIKAIVIKKSNKYKLVDGYHRCFSSKKGEFFVLNAY